MEDKKEISKNSTPEEVVEFFSLNFMLDKKELNCLIKEDISGDILPLLEKEDYKELGLKFGQKLKIQKYIEANLDKLKMDELDIKIDISINSDENRIKIFLKNYLKFTKNATNIDGKKLLSLSEQDMKDLGFTIGQRKKLKIYIDYFNKKNKDNHEILITDKSSIKDVAQFMKKKFNIPEKIIEGLALDGESLFLMSEADLDEIEDISPEAKNNIKNFLASRKKEDKEEIKSKNLTELDTIKEVSEQILIDNDNNDINNKKNNLIIDNNVKKSVNNAEVSSYSIANETAENFSDKLKSKDNNLKKGQIKNEINDSIKIDNNNDKGKIEEQKNNLEDIKNNDKNINNNLNTIEIKKSILKEYEGFKLDENLIIPLNNYHIEPIINDSKYNIFFFLIIENTFIEKLKISIYVSETKINFKYYFLYEYIEPIFDLRFILIQIPINKNSKKLTVLFEENNKQIKEKIEVEYNIRNYFYLEKIIYPNDIKRDIKNSDIINHFFIYFFDKICEKEERFKIDLIQNISQKSKLELDIEVYFAFLKYCFYLNFKPRNINEIIIIKEEYDTMLKKFDKKFYKEYFTFCDYKKYNLEYIEKIQLFVFLMKNYIPNDKNFIAEIIKSKSINEYCLMVLYALDKKKIEPNLIKFINEKEQFDFMKYLLEICNSFYEINLALKLSKNLTNSLKIIIQNYKSIYNIIKKEQNVSIGTNIFLHFSELNDTDKINDIYNLIPDLIKINDTNEFIQIIDFKKLVDILIRFYYNKSIKEFWEIKKILDILKSQKLIEENSIEYFHKLLHNKGIRMIANNNMNVDEIIDFVFNKDIYYHDPRYNDDKLKDPIIFTYIKITKREKNYQHNIQKLKENKIWEIYQESSDYMKINFYNCFLDQLLTITDLEYIFELFPINLKDKIFFNLISNKLLVVIHSIFREKEENYEIIFKIFINYFKCSEANGVKANYFEINKLDFIFVSKFYYYLAIQKEEIVLNRLKNEILAFYFQQNLNKLNGDILIQLILLSPDADFTLEIFNNMEYFVLTENDFYRKDNNINFQIFRLFFEKCSDLIKEYHLSKAKYLSKALLIKDKIKKDLLTNNIQYDLINNLIDEDNIFFNKILVIFDNDKNTTEEVYNRLKNNVNLCQEKLRKYELIEDYYSSFYKTTKRNIIEQIKLCLDKLRQDTLEKIINLDENEFIKVNNFNFKEAEKESENIKYKYSLFFMAIYNKKYNENLEKDEEKIFIETKKNFEETMTKIIKQNENNEPFFDIENINEIMKAIRDKNNNNLEKEINFLFNEFADLNMGEYIQKNLLDDLINFSNKEKIQYLIEGILSFNESFCRISNFEITNFNKSLSDILKKLNSNYVSGENIREANALLMKLKFDINIETQIINFYILFLGKEDSIDFIRTIKDSNLEIRNLNEFIDENENSTLQITDIDNLLDVYTFCRKIMDNKGIKTDENFHILFRKEFEAGKDIGIKLMSYLNSYGEIYQLYQLYDENSEMTTQKISKILKNSTLEIYQENNENSCFSYKINYSNNKNKNIEINSIEIDELKNKILISSGTKNTNILNNEIIDKEELTKKFVELIENIQHLVKCLNQLIETGYPYVNNLILEINDSEAYERGNKYNNLEYIMKIYNEKNNEYKNLIKEGYEKYPLIRLFYGRNFIQLYKITKNENINISHLVNSMTLNKIKDFDINFKYNEGKNNIENINDYLEILFKKNNCLLQDIYKRNIIIKTLDIPRALYKIEKNFDDSELNTNILNIYINLTGNSPIRNTLLICNVETNLEEIKAFLFRARFCEYEALFVISNLECLSLYITQEFFKILNELYVNNYKLYSILIIIYAKNDSGLSRDIKTLIPDKYDFINTYIKKPIKNIPLFKDIDLYTSKFAGYGKTTEIKYQIKMKKGNYYYFPIGGTLSRNFVINNLEKLNIDLKNGKNAYLHLDLSETDNDYLMDEILIKLIIMRYLDSSNKIFYLGSEVHIIIELPKGFIDFEEKYKLLKLFNKISIDKLPPLRLEENAKIIKDSPISIVAETLALLENGENFINNINLEGPITKTSQECENIINKYFKVENKNYYQKTNFIKILSVQFKKFHECIYLNIEIVDPERTDIIKQARKTILENFISLTKVFTQSPYDSILNEQIEALNQYGKYDEKKLKENAIKSLSGNKKEIFSFELIKPSLVFFNKDGQSLSIISNNNKNDNEYKNLKALWNSQNVDENVQNELVDYKNLNHEGFLEQIKILFSLDNKNIDDNKKNEKIDIIEEKKIEINENSEIENNSKKKNNEIILEENSEIEDKIIKEKNEKIEENKKESIERSEVEDEILKELNEKMDVEIKIEDDKPIKKNNKNIEDEQIIEDNTIKYLKKFCESHGNYIFVCDNYIKMVRILLNIEAKIPVILMGETGVGKTKLIEVLSELYGNGKCIWRTLQIHAGITDQEIIDFIDKIIEENKKSEDKDKLKWVFFDEINTCNSLGLITEIMCNHTYLGQKIDDNFIFIGACNPYRIITKKMKESGLVYYNMKEKNKLNNLVYTVNPLPHSLLNFVFDFGNLQPQDEKKYITNNVKSMLSNIAEQNLIEKKDINDEILTKIIESIAICHNFIREIYDRSSVSMREIRRFRILFEYFISYFKKFINNSGKMMEYSLNLSIYLCYYLRLNDKNSRRKLIFQLEKYFNNNFLGLPEHVSKIITEQMTIEKNSGIALNRALRENLFSIFICIINTIPLIIIGKPGTSKSLSFQILYNTMKGQYSENKYFKDKGKLYRYYYQGSETSTSKGIEKVFEKAIKAQAKNKNKNIITLVFFDEMGLAERSNNNPLKVMHYLLEKDSENSVPFLGVSNWRLDASKINRVLNLAITDYDIEDLEETAISIAEALNIEFSTKYKDFFITLASTYNEYIKFNQRGDDKNKDFHGNRDFYNLIKNSMREIIKINEENKELEKNERKILTEIGIRCLEINFGGLEYSTKRIKEIFKNEYGHKFFPNYDIKKNISIIDIIRSNINDSNRRYLMLISEGNDASEVIKYILLNMKKEYYEIVGSKYKDDIKYGKYSEEILNKIKYIMESDKILILRDLDMIYASLYDVFNQNFTCMGGKKFARIAFEYAKISSEININFRVVIIVNKEKIEELKLDPPFLNRFEKHIINFSMILNNKDIEISKKIWNYIEEISGIKNKNLTLNLEKLLINCKGHNINGLIFKIKTNKNLAIEDPKYEIIIIEEILQKIVPTFCQDIIAYLMTSKISLEFQKINELVINIYQKNRFSNFITFFEKIVSRRNVVYTFSKITEDIFNDDEYLENNFGKFRIREIESQIIQSINSEKDLIFLLKNFADNNDKKILILKLSGKELNQMNSIKYIITNFEKENKSLEEKIIILTVHMKRKLKIEKLDKKEEVDPDYISFLDEDYYQIFIDNLKGKERYNIFDILSEKTEYLAKRFLIDSHFIENKIYAILNYLDININNECDEFNLKNCNNIIAEEIINHEELKNLILNSLIKQGGKIKEIINDVFSSKTLEINDVDFYEVVNSKFNDYFSNYLLNIIIDSLKRNILIPLLKENNFEKIMKNEFFLNLITSQFDRINYNIIPRPKQIFNYNRVTIFYGLILPHSKIPINQIIKYVNEEISKRYLNNEEVMRKENINNEDKKDLIQDYTNELEKIKENAKVEIYKEEYFNTIFNQNDIVFKELILKDYLTIYLIQYKSKNETNFIENEKIINFLNLILKLKLKRETILAFNFENTIDEFIEILFFTQAYFEDICYLINIYLEIQKYCENIEDIIFKVLNEFMNKYQISEINNDYSKLVNFPWFSIIESLTRSILIYSMELFEINRNKFYEYFRTLPAIEANLQKLNNKYCLNSKEIFNLGSIIKINEYYKYNFDQFENYYKNIVDKLLQQSLALYDKDYANYLLMASDLNKIFDNSFREKKEEFINLNFFIFLQKYKVLQDEETKIKLAEEFFKNNMFYKKSNIILTDTLMELRPKIGDDNFLIIKNNLNLDKFGKLYEIYNGINSVEFDEILLFCLENLCQAYFQEIIDSYYGEYNKESCEQILLKMSLDNFTKAQKYLYEHKNNYEKILKLISIAYIKTYIYYYVEINYHYNKLCNFSKINKILDDENNDNKIIRNTRNIYLWRVYLKKFENFEQFKDFNYKTYNIPIFKELLDRLNEEDNNNKVQYIFTESFINLKSFEEFKLTERQIVMNSKNFDFNYDEINKNFDILYCSLVNKVLSYLYHTNKKMYIDKLKRIFEESKDKIKFEQEGLNLYEILMNNEKLENIIIHKISDKPLNQKDFEILLYSFRFMLNVEINKGKCFYKDLLKKNISKFINNNFIPGSFPILNEFIKSYNILEEILPKKENVGYYICKDCGYLYYVPPCTLPTSEEKCPNGHVIGGIDHECSKKDIRVFPDIKSRDEYADNTSFVSVTLEEFKKNYVDKYNIQKEKGIIEGYRNLDFIRKDYLTNLNVITYRTLNFILYSFILGSYILNNLSEKEMTAYLVKNLQPHTIFGIIKQNWILLNDNLKEVGIENSQIFFNMIFDQIVEFMNNLESVDTREKLEYFEKRVNEYILNQISKDQIKKINEEYKKLNEELLNLNFNNLKEIIINTYEPSFYSQEKYPDIQYYCVSTINNIDTFTKSFNSSNDNKKKYSLINILVNQETNFSKNVINMKCLIDINRLSNLLIRIYSYKIEREEAKKNYLKMKLTT